MGGDGGGVGGGGGEGRIRWMAKGTKVWGWTLCVIGIERAECLMDMIPIVACFITGFWPAFRFIMLSSICLPQCHGPTTGFAASPLYPYSGPNASLNAPITPCSMQSIPISSSRPIWPAACTTDISSPSSITSTFLNCSLYPIHLSPSTLHLWRPCHLRTATRRRISTKQQQKTPTKPSTPPPFSPPFLTSDS